MSETENSEAQRTSFSRMPSVRIGAVLAVAIGAAFVVWLFVRSNDDDSPSASTTTAQTAPVIGPVAAGQARLRALSAKVGHPVYWIGPRQGKTYELTRAGDRVFIRYLPQGAAIGNKQANYTIVGTYPTAHALKVLKKLSKQSGEKSAQVPGGGIAVYGVGKPTNVYVAYPSSDVQIEVFDPSAARALRLATSGSVVPVD